MSWDYDKQKEKKEKILNTLGDSLKEQGFSESEAKQAAEEIFKSYVNISPPEKEMVVLHLVTTSSFGGRGGGKSVKPGNVRLNMPKLLEAISAGVITCISVKADPWAIPFAAILLWQSLWATMKVDLSETDVAVLITLNRLKNKNKIVTQSENEILEAVNKALVKYSRSIKSVQELKLSLKNLDQIDSIDIVKDGLFIREWVKVSYR